ncbi:MAG: AAA family ATPase, partial [Candidatus Shapirobacteria bacterium]
MPNSYFFWHYLAAPKAIIKIIGNYLIFFTHYFSVPLLAKTLLAPWKRQIGQREKLGWDLNDLATVFVTNVISRVIGAIIRLATLLTWLLAEILIFILGSSLLLFWLILPGLTLPLFWLWRPRPSVATTILQKGRDNPVKVFRLLLQTPAVKFMCQRLNLSLEELDDLAANTSWEILTFPPVKNEGELLTFLAQNWPPLENYLNQQHIKPTDLLTCFAWYRRLTTRRQKAAKFWHLENLLQNPGFGKNWTYGYTPVLDKFTHDLTMTSIEPHHLVGRQIVAEQMERVLTRNQSRNVILIGEPGIGKQTIMLNLARRIKNGQTSPALAYKRLLNLNLTQILASGQPAQAIANLENLLQEAAQAGNIILVIPHLASFIQLAETLIKSLQENKIQVIGSSTPDEYQKTLLPQEELLKYFEKVEASAPSLDEAKIILQDAMVEYEQKTPTLILYQAIQEALVKSEEYLTEAPFPEKALDLLDEACVLATKNNQILVTAKEVDQVLSQKTEIPLDKIEKEEIEKLKNLEKMLAEKIIGQKTAIGAITQTIRRARLGIASRHKPYGSFLFLGPTGVGKTQTAKVLAGAYFGAEERLIRFDMSEYQG